MKRFVTSFLIVSLVWIIGSPVPVFGQEDLDTLLAISDDETLTDEERFVKAKGGLTLALSLAIEKVERLRTNLQERTYDDESVENILKATFVLDLDGYGFYYSETLITTDTLTTLEEVKGLAQDVRTYRDEIYTPGIEKIVQFILVFYADDVIGIASDRFGKISEDINTLESLGLIKVDVFLEETTQIESLLEEARSLNAQVKDVTLVMPSDEEVLVEEEPEVAPSASIDAPDTDDASTTTQELAVDEGDVRDDAEDEETTDPLETSLNNVKLVYEIFLKISRDVKATLGLD